MKKSGSLRTWTPAVFWAVTAVMTEEQYAPRAAQALTSAWMPAPALESEPATVSTCGHGISRAAASLHGRVRGERCGRRGDEKEETEECGCRRRIGGGGADDMPKCAGGEKICQFFHQTVSCFFCF